MLEGVLFSFVFERIVQVYVVGSNAETLETCLVGNAFLEVLFHIGKRDSIVGSFGS